MSHQKLLLQMIGLAMAVIILAGCGGEQAEPSTTPTPVPPTFTPTPAPADTPSPMPTSIPTSLPTHTPLPTLAALVRSAEMEGTVGPIYSLAWSPDGDVLASAGFRQVKLWDTETNEKLDKDRFRRDMGSVAEAYQEVARRLGILPEIGPRDLRTPLALHEPTAN